jgi:acetylornithine deacetylase/succinyl-diaminopimelate desuccinylase-like protein
MINTDIKTYIDENNEQMLEILKELCHIPAPSHFEHKRAQYCKDKLESMGAQGVYVDDALNVVFPLGCEDSNEITVFVAHTDTVFPDTEPMPYFDDGEKIHCPGASDDTASVAVLIMAAKYFIENAIVPEKGVMFVCNSCEEGLGNLKGTRQIFKDYDGRIARFISFDSILHHVANRCVGSHRYEVEVLTEGGHSFGAFGNDNAIAKLSEIVTEIYKIEVPQKEGTRTTYNVGTITGGTSVNTIAQNAKMLCEYRSDDKDCLEIMQKKFESIFEAARTDKIEVNVKKVGDRPCSNIDTKEIDALEAIAVPIIEKVINKKVAFKSSSTDCNIPLSLGVPALCVGVNLHAGVHTREEWVDKASLIPGLEIAIKLVKAFTEV